MYRNLLICDALSLKAITKYWYSATTKQVPIDITGLPPVEDVEGSEDGSSSEVEVTQAPKKLKKQKVHSHVLL